MANLEFMPQTEGFLALEDSNSENAKAVIIPFGLEASVSYGSGTALGPQAIIESSHQVELFDEEHWCEPHLQFGIATLKEPKISQNIDEALMQLSSSVQHILDQDKFPLVLGGEHTITPGAIRPFLKKYSDLTILHFDAHADLRDVYDDNSYSHACAIRRCLDDPKLNYVVSCGIRNISSEEIPFLEANRERIEIHWAKDKSDWDISKIVKPLQGKNIYITVDVDGFDPSIMPATGTPEPGGLLWDDVIQIIRAANQVGNVVGADINELAPISGFHACDFLAAKLAYKILSYKFLAK